MRPQLISLLAVVLACVAAPSAVRAQEPLGATVTSVTPDVPLVPPGTSLRVTDQDGAARLGRFWYLRADTLWLRTPEDEAAAVPLTGRERIEIDRGRRRELWSAGGALAGMALGVLGSQLNGSDGGANGSAHNASEAVLAAVGGAVLGGLTGWFVAPQRWERVDPPPPALLPPPPAPTAAAAPAP